jgi:hypothetical protein
MAVRLSALRAGRSLLPGRFLVLSRPQGYSAAGRIRLIKKSNDLFGNRTRDLLACSIVPQPSTLPRTTVHGTVLRLKCFYTPSCIDWGGGKKNRLRLGRE